KSSILEDARLLSNPDRTEDRERIEDQHQSDPLDSFDDVGPQAQQRSDQLIGNEDDACKDRWPKCNGGKDLGASTDNGSLHEEVSFGQKAGAQFETATSSPAHALIPPLLPTAA